jgi:hypothetical protein
MKKETAAEQERLINITMDVINEYHHDKYVKWLTYPAQPRKRVLAKLGELKEVLDVVYANEQDCKDSDGQTIPLSLVTFNIIISDLCWYAYCHKDFSNVEATQEIEDHIQRYKRTYVIEHMSLEEILKLTDDDFYYALWGLHMPNEKENKIFGNSLNLCDKYKTAILKKKVG